MAIQGFVMWVAIMLSFKAGFASNSVVAIWPAAGFSVAMAIYYQWRAFPALFAASFAYSVLFQQNNLGVFACTAAGNAVAAIVAADLYRRLGGPRQPLKSVAGAIKLIMILALTMSVFAALLGMATIHLTFGLAGTELWQLGWRWFFSDFTGAVLVAPALLAVFGSWRRVRLSFWRALLGNLRLPGLACASALALLYLATDFMPDGLDQYPMVLLTMPLWVWLSLRTDTASSISLLCISVIGALALTLSAIGDASEGAFLAVQLYGLVASCTSLVLHASGAERQRAVRALAVERQSLEDTVMARTAQLEQQIAANQQANQRLAQLARTDALTGIANRREFMAVGGKELARARRVGMPLSIVMLDIDHFKRVNDQHGHAAGDAVLVATAATITDSAREGIDLVARLGGEEFACLLPNTSVEQAGRFAERIRSGLEALTVPYNGLTLKITVSLGVSTCDDAMESIGQALQLADEALYEAKNSGRNQVVCRPPRSQIGPALKAGVV